MTSIGSFDLVTSKIQDLSFDKSLVLLETGTIIESAGLDIKLFLSSCFKSLNSILYCLYVRL